MRRLSFAFYNLAPPAPNRDTERIAVELNAIAKNKPRRLLDRRPKIIGVCEAVGYNLPALPHYTLIRSRTTASRANVALYVRNDITPGAVRWQTLTETWPRTEHPGPHPPRTRLVVRIEDWTVAVDHAPPTAPGAGPAREEWLRTAARFLKGNGPRLLLSDPNALGDDLQRAVPNAHSGGTAIEAAHANRAILDEIQTPREINGVVMLSDHQRCLLGRATRG